LKTISSDVNADKPVRRKRADLKGGFQMFQDICKRWFSIAENFSIIDVNDEHSELLIYFPFTLMSEINTRISFILGYAKLDNECVKFLIACP
jgi:hypothetical protein